jgi:Family of unknown function (DUF5675)
VRITINRTRQTTDGLLGNLSIDWNPFTCFTIENRALSIPSGVYPIEFSWSPHFNAVMPHVLVPNRTDIMIHPANYPIGPDPNHPQLLGCIGVGDKEEPDAVDNSRVTFNILNRIMSLQAGIDLQINDFPALPA